MAHGFLHALEKGGPGYPHGIRGFPPRLRVHDLYLQAGSVLVQIFRQRRPRQRLRLVRLKPRQQGGVLGVLDQPVVLDVLDPVLGRHLASPELGQEEVAHHLGHVELVLHEVGPAQFVFGRLERLVIQSVLGAHPQQFDLEGAGEIGKLYGLGLHFPASVRVSESYQPIVPHGRECLLRLHLGFATTHLFWHKGPVFRDQCIEQLQLYRAPRPQLHGEHHESGRTRPFL